MLCSPRLGDFDCFEIEQTRISACYWNGVYAHVVGGKGFENKKK